MILWKEKKIADLLLDGNTIQNPLPKYKQTSIDTDVNISKRFRSLISTGNVNGALRLLDKKNNNYGVLPINDSTKDLLNEKHPKAQPLFDELLVDNNNVQEVHPIIFDRIDSELMRVATLTKGAAGPSKLDADACRKNVGLKAFHKRKY